MIEVFEGDRATNYDQFVQTWIPNYAAFVNQLPDVLAGIVYKKLLVVGCGTGNEMIAFAKDDSWSIVGVDPSPEMIVQAQQKLEKYPRISLVTGEVNTLPSDLTFGAATLLLVLHFLKDDGAKLDLLHQIADKLLPGATLILLDITGDASQITENLKILRNLISKKEVDEEQIDVRVNRIKHELHHVSENRLAELLTEAGFDMPVRFFQSTVYMGWLTKKIDKQQT